MGPLSVSPSLSRPAVGMKPVGAPEGKEEAPSSPVFSGKDSISLSKASGTSSSVRFSGVLDKNQGVELPMDVPLGLEQSLQAQRVLLIQMLQKQVKDDGSNLTMWMDSLTDFSGFAAIDGLADALGMVDRPVDAVVKGCLSTPTLKPFMSATGKRLMTDRARINMAPPKGWFQGPVHESNSRARLFNEKHRELEWLMMSRTGASRAQIQDDFRIGHEYNALSALAYAKRGLVDGVLVDENAVLTRKTLNEYYKAHDLAGAKNRDAREAFNADYDSIDRVVAWARENGKLQTVQEFSPKMVAQKPAEIYKSAVAADDKGDDAGKTDAAKTAEPPTQAGNPDNLVAQLTELLAKFQAQPKDGQAGDKKAEEKPAFQVYGHRKDGKIDKLTIGPVSGLLEKPLDLRSELANVPSGAPNTYLRDTVYFPTGFDVATGKQVEAALKQLAEKKKQQKANGQPIQNISIVENSPGGMSIVTEQLKSAIAQLGVPVDVIVQGMGASGGSKLVSMATGNRFITPNSSILLHQTRGGQGLDNLEEVSESAAGMAYSSNGYMSLVSQRSGRPFEEVKRDFKVDFWTNAVESILYGPNGLVDGILVGPDHVLTRDDVMDFVIEKKGSREAAEEYIQAKYEERRLGESAGLAKNHKEVDEDPMANPLAVIEELTKRGKVKKLSQVDQFKPSTSDVSGNPDKTADWYTVTEAK